MSFTPSSNIYIGSVPFDPSYKHYHYIPNRDAQYQHFLSLCPNSLRRGDYTYQRVNNSVVVPFNAETLYGYNYCMFQNENYGNRWFYSFITDVEYVNPEATRLYLSLDVMQTWFPDCKVNACLVEREHVNDDSIGANLRDEGISPGMLKQQSVKVVGEGGWMTLVASVAEPTTTGYVNSNGDVYGLVYSGASRTVFANIGGHDALTDFQSFMLALSNNGQQDAVASAWMVPLWMATWGGVSRLYDKDDGFGFWLRNKADSTAATRTHDVTVSFSDCDGYSPKNNKLFTYPFSKLVVSTATGDQEYALEFFGSVEGLGKGSSASVVFEEVSAWEPDSAPFLYPLNYNGMGSDGQDLSINLPPWPTVNWVYQSFTNLYSGGYGRQLSASLENAGASYQASNVNALFSLLTSIGNGAMSGAVQGSAVPGIGTAAGAVMGAASSSIQAGTNYFNTRLTNDVGLENQYRSANADLAKAAHTPNAVRGTVSSSAQALNSGMYQTWFRVYRPRAEIAKAIDDFFSIYGYRVGEIKVPNMTGRKSWNYVKTNGAGVVGDVPSPVLAQVNSLFDRGITFWHTNDVGNYALDNSIV